MKKSICFLVLFLISAIFTLNAQDKVQQFDEYVQKSFKKWDIPSVAIAVVIDGEIVLEKAYGYTDWDKKDKVDQNTLYPIGSISKSFCVLSLAQLVQEGKISWNTKVKSIIPDLKLYNDYVTDNVIVEDLVSHRIGYGTFSGDLLWYHTNYSVDEIIPKLQYLNPVYDFRNGYGYSNVMFILAGKVVENVSGVSYEKYVEENVLKNIKMDRTTLDISKMEKNRNFAKGCYKNLQGEEIKIDYIPSLNIKAFGGVNSCVHDMANYMIMLMNNGVFDNKIVVDKNQINYFWKLHNATGVTQYMKNSHPQRHFYGYGLGWFLFDQNGYKIINHDGGMDGALSSLFMIPEKNTGVIVLTNSSNFLYTALAQYFLDLFTDLEPKDWSKYYLDVYPRYLSSYQKMKDEHRQVKNTETSLSLDKYAGTYVDEMYGAVNVIYKNEKLSLNFVPAPYLNAELKHWHYNTFEIKFNNPNMAIPTQWGLVNFILNEDGEISNLKMIVPNYDFLFDELNFLKK